MKRIISILLCYVTLMACSPQYRQEAHAQTVAVVFVMSIVAVGAMATVYICQKQGENKTRWFVLEKGYLDGRWTPVATNALRMTIGHAFPAFQSYMVDDLATYRIKEIPCPTNYWNPQVVLGRLDNPIVQTP